jgi:hypothetical protein
MTAVIFHGTVLNTVKNQRFLFAFLKHLVFLQEMFRKQYDHYKQVTVPNSAAGIVCS